MAACCGNCHYALDDDGIFVCRRYPPAVIWMPSADEAGSSSPEVDGDWWCGEYFPKAADA
jgi:hypothetical protein